MARTVVTTVRSDLTGVSKDASGEADRYNFTLDGTRYTIDVTPGEWNAFLSGGQDGNGEDVTVPRMTTLARVVSTKAGGNDEENDENGESGVTTEGELIREWGRANGYDVKDRGKLSKALKDAYAKAHEDVPEAQDA